MLRDEARAFLVAGGALESADMVLRMLRVALPRRAADDDAATGQAHARCCSAVGGFQAFRRSVAAPPNADPVARFLLFERAYPDSVAASVARCAVRSLADADATAAQLGAGAAPRPPQRRPRVPPRATRDATPTWRGVCEQVQHELAPSTRTSTTATSPAPRSTRQARHAR